MIRVNLLNNIINFKLYVDCRSIKILKVLILIFKKATCWKKFSVTIKKSWVKCSIEKNRSVIIFLSVIIIQNSYYFYMYIHNKELSIILIIFLKNNHTSNIKISYLVIVYLLYIILSSAPVIKYITHFYCLSKIRNTFLRGENYNTILEY